MNATTTIELPIEFDEQLKDAILTMAREAFNTVKAESAYHQYMKVDEACEFLNCSRNTLTGKYVRMGLPIILLEKAQYISKDDAIAFMNEHKI